MIEFENSSNLFEKVSFERYPFTLRFATSAFGIEVLEFTNVELTSQKTLDPNLQGTSDSRCFVSVHNA